MSEALRLPEQDLGPARGGLRSAVHLAGVGLTLHTGAPPEDMHFRSTWRWRGRLAFASGQRESEHLSSKVLGAGYALAGNRRGRPRNWRRHCVPGSESVPGLGGRGACGGQTHPTIFFLIVFKLFCFVFLH